MSYASKVKSATTTDGKPSVNTTGNGTSRKQTGAAKSPTEDMAAQGKISAVMAHFITNLRGEVVVVELSNGTKFEGVFAGFDAGAESLSVTLRAVQQSRDADLPPNVRNLHPFAPQRTFAFKDIITLRTGQMEAAALRSASQGKRGAFRTDDEIGHHTVEDRPLEKWQPDEGDHLEESDGLGNLPRQGRSGGWDQFKTNEEKFGVTSTYNFEEYTTPLDRDSDFYRQNEQWAAAKESEIMNAPAENVHQADERGQDVSKFTQGLDEEDMYSLVVDKTGQKNGAYQVPQRRPGPETGSRGPNAQGPRTGPAPVVAPAAATTANASRSWAAAVKKEEPKKDETGGTPSAASIPAAAAIQKGNGPAAAKPAASQPTSSAASPAPNASPAPEQLPAKSAPASAAVSPTIGEKTDGTASAAPVTAASGEAKKKTKLKATAAEFVPTFGSTSPVAAAVTMPQQPMPWNAPSMPPQMMPMPMYNGAMMGNPMMMSIPPSVGPVYGYPQMYYPPQPNYPMRGFPPQQMPMTMSQRGMPPAGMQVQMPPQYVPSSPPSGAAQHGGHSMQYTVPIQALTSSPQLGAAAPPRHMNSSPPGPD